MYVIVATNLQKFGCYRRYIDFDNVADIVMIVDDYDLFLLWKIVL